MFAGHEEGREYASNIERSTVPPDSIPLHVRTIVFTGIDFIIVTNIQEMVVTPTSRRCGSMLETCCRQRDKSVSTVFTEHEEETAIAIASKISSLTVQPDTIAMHARPIVFIRVYCIVGMNQQYVVH